MKTLIKTRKLSASQIIMFSFLTVILIGSILLMLPVSSRTGEVTPFMDALFTATSAVCVTGLVVKDTATYWSSFGQALILLMIQIGGMGVITVAIMLSLVSGKKIGLKQRQTMQEAISAPKVGGILKLTKFIVMGMFLIEALGALILMPVFISETHSGKGIWYAIFHSISAFCNAGFDLMGQKAHFSSLTWYQNNPVVNITIMLLIIIGGLGFLTWDDIVRHKYHFRRYRMQSKVILTTSAVLIALPALYFFFCEYQNLTIGSRIWTSLFQSVTTRTAGFNTADLTELHDSGKVLMIALMLVGGSPGSTAGGMKTTTFAVLAVCVMTVLRRRDTVHCFGRRIPNDGIIKAASVLLMYLVLFVTGGCVISYIEGIPVLTALFETASAVGTVGLTLGITTQLGLISRLILIGLMFFGRVGGLTLIFAAVSEPGLKGNHFPEEKITIG
ncbi:MAG: TrkH family potassium uptake protein [Muricoprocola sp.]